MQAIRPYRVAIDLADASVGLGGDKHEFAVDAYAVGTLSPVPLVPNPIPILVQLRPTVLLGLYQKSICTIEYE